MFSFVKGTLNEINEEYIVVENEMYGLEIFVPSSVFRAFTKIGEEVKIYTYFQPREDSFNLYGFSSKDEKEVFKKLLSVNGIGAKAGLAILSAISVDELKTAVATGDHAMITRAKGIGKKTAQKLILELKDKLDMIDISDINVLVDAGADIDDALVALVSLGYSNYEAKKAISKCEDKSSTEAIIKACLKQLATM